MYEIRYLSQVVKHDLPGIDAFVRGRIFRSIERMSAKPENFGEPLHHGLKGLYKLRVGDWRVIYEIRHRETVVVIVKIGHRREVYNR